MLRTSCKAVRHPEPYETPPGDDQSIAIALATFRCVPRPHQGQHAIVSPWHMSNDTSQLPMRCAMSATRDDTSSLTSSMSEA